MVKNSNIPSDGRPDLSEDVLSPDTYGAERVFIEHFVNDDMVEDFPLIARDFYMHEYTNLLRYESVEYLDIDSGEDWPEIMFIRFTMNLMMNAVNSGSGYAKALFLYLHKTYHKKEYKTLKKFSSISLGELIALAEPQEDSSLSYYGNLARILCISPMYGITIKPDCGYIYAMLNEFSDRLDENEPFSFSEATGNIFQESEKEIEQRYELKKLYSADCKASKFLGNALRWLGYSPDFAELCDENDMGIERRLATTLSILKKTYPNREYTAEELAVYGVLLHTASALTCCTDKMSEMLKILAYGETGTYYYEDFPAMFHPEEISVKSLPKKSTEMSYRTEKPSDDDKTKTAPGKEAVFMEEITALRRKVHRLENENNNLRTELVGKRKAEENAKTCRDQSEEMSRELSALRDYVYNLTEDDSPEQSVSMDKMKEILAEKHIVIIGGHSNWVSKMKKEFPRWVFVNPEASGSTDTNIVDKADYVYFFTDTISHSKYYRFMNVVREHKVDFGYIHGVNIEKTIQKIYRDFEEE